MVAPRQWRVYATSVVGHAHITKDVPCQDSSAAGVFDDAEWAWAIVADGHGSDRCFRSDRGSLLAVQVLTEAFESVRGLADAGVEDGISTVPTSRWEDWAASRVVGRWRDLVYRDLLADPPSADDEELLGRRLDSLKTRRGWTAASQLVREVESFRAFALDSRPRLAESDPISLHDLPGWDDQTMGNWQVGAYGSTLLGIVASPDALHWFQLGDGAMIKITGGDAAYLQPPPAEAIANETPSLSSSDAVRAVNVGTVHLAAGDIPSTLILTTDGIPNSYETIEGFLSFCTEVATRAYDDGVIPGKLADWLPEISRQGSGDDVSIAIVYSSETETQVQEPEQARDSPDITGSTEVQQSEPRQSKFRFPNPFSHEKTDSGDHLC